MYRIRTPDHRELVYIGQGDIASRLRSHLAKAGREGYPQAQHFSLWLEASWVTLPGIASVNLLEHENDLIAAHYLALGYPPAAQFLGERT